MVAVMLKKRAGRFSSLNYTEAYPKELLRIMFEGEFYTLLDFSV
jgi:hypothetical protein